MTSQFKVIGIFGRIKNPGSVATLESLVQFLRSHDQAFLMDEETAEALNDTSIPTISREDLSQQCDMLIVVGGDGSLLQAAHGIVKDEVPVLGINRGRLGFLTDILPREMEKIGDILKGKYSIEKRFLLSATVTLDGQRLGEGDALNEVALIPNSVPHMNEFEIYIDNQFVCSQDSDGVIIATPTGSTAYALSGGGPILHPQLDAIVMVPMFPHTLTLRPLVVEGNQRISIAITPKNTAVPRLSCDSQSFINTPPGSLITVEKKKHRLHLIHPLDYDYYQTLRSKLHWGRKLHYADQE